MKKFLMATFILGTLNTADAQNTLRPRIDKAVEAVKDKVIAWRRDIHQHPELGNQEFRTAKLVATHLRSLGIDVTENVGVTGVVGILKGGKPGPVVALRADMDALPVTERVDVPFKSTVKTIYRNQETGVMHACGHDSHVAMLMGAAEVLAGMRNELAGTVKFFFQPAEEGVDTKEPFGAHAMVLAGVMENPKVDAVFGIHISSNTPAGVMEYKSGPDMAAVDGLHIRVNGKQSHGAYPWGSVDPIVTGSQIVLGLQTILSRNVPVNKTPAVVTVGAFNGGIRENIIPEKVEMIGTIRTFSKENQAMVHRRIREIATNIAESAGATADVTINKGYPVTFNNVALTNRMVPVLEAAAGKENVREREISMGAEDFSYFAEAAPGLFLHLGAMPRDKKPEEAAPHHTPDFYLDESGFHVGVRTFAYLVADFFDKKK